MRTNHKQRAILLLELTLCFLLIVLVALGCVWTLSGTRRARQQTQFQLGAQSVLDNVTATLEQGVSTTLSGTAVLYGVKYGYTGHVTALSPRQLAVRVSWTSPAGANQTLSAQTQAP